jgi:hypothetical protein
MSMRLILASARPPEPGLTERPARYQERIRTRRPGVLRSSQFRPRSEIIRPSLVPRSNDVPRLLKTPPAPKILSPSNRWDSWNSDVVNEISAATEDAGKPGLSTAAGHHRRSGSLGGPSDAGPARLMIRAGCDGPAGENAGSFTAVAAQGPRGLDILDETGGRSRPWRCARCRPSLGRHPSARDFADSHGTPFSRTVSLNRSRVRPLSPPVRCAFELRPFPVPHPV